MLTPKAEQQRPAVDFCFSDGTDVLIAHPPAGIFAVGDASTSLLDLRLMFGWRVREGIVQ